jgi:hypothetical protein
MRSQAVGLIAVAGLGAFVALGQHLVRDLPHFGELAVVTDDTAFLIDHKNVPDAILRNPIVLTSRAGRPGVAQVLRPGFGGAAAYSKNCGQ